MLLVAERKGFRINEPHGPIHRPELRTSSSQRRGRRPSPARPVGVRSFPVPPRHKERANSSTIRLFIHRQFAARQILRATLFMSLLRSWGHSRYGLIHCTPSDSRGPRVKAIFKNLPSASNFELQTSNFELSPLPFNLSTFQPFNSLFELQTLPHEAPW